MLQYATKAGSIFAMPLGYQNAYGITTLLNMENQILLIYPASMTFRKLLHNSAPHT